MKRKFKYILPFLAIVLFCSCNNKTRMEREAQEKIEREAMARALAEEREWQEVKSLVNKATGLTTDCKEERKLALVKLRQMFPGIKRWGDIDDCIVREEFYKERDDLLFEIKKLKGWVDLD